MGLDIIQVDIVFDMKGKPENFFLSFVQKEKKVFTLLRAAVDEGLRERK
jgi:hypothetical protein